MKKKVSADEASTAEVLDNIKECVHRNQDLREKSHSSVVDSVPRNGRHVALLYKSRTQRKLGTSPRGIDQNAARPQLVCKVCLTIFTFDERLPNGCLPSLHLRSSRSKKKWSILGWIIDRPSHRTGSYKKSEDQWRLDQREGPNGTTDTLRYPDFHARVRLAPFWLH